MFLREYILYWYNTYAKHRQRRNTQESYMYVIKLHIIDTDIADKHIADITTLDIQQLFNYLLTDGYKGHGRKLGEKRGLSNSQVIKVRQILMRMFEHALYEGLINRNPVKMTEPIPKTWTDKPVFTPEQQVKFLEVVKNDRYYPAYILFFYLGMRRSEIAGLSWNNINFTKNQLKVSQTVIIENGKPVLRNTTKTRTSIRVIPFPLEIHRILKDYQRKIKAEKIKNEDDLVFIKKDGTGISPESFSRKFKQVCRKLGFSKKLHLHSARHTWATNMIQAGATITDIQALGGWSDASMLLNVYSHTVKQSQKRSMNKLVKEISIK